MLLIQVVLEKVVLELLVHIHPIFRIYFYASAIGMMMLTYNFIRGSVECKQFNFYFCFLG